MVFTIENYPKSYASVKKDDYRLINYLNLSDEALEKLRQDFADFCFNYAEKTKPVTEYKGFKYIDSGWEWSVFRKDPKIVIKIPAGIFPEVNDPRYLANSQDSYQKVVASYPSELVAQTKFYRENDINVLEQEYIEGEIDFVVKRDTTDKQLLKNFRIFLLSTLQLVQDNDWLPDYWFKEQDEGILVRNVILEKETKLFKVIDFTQYFDPSRMYPALTKSVISKQIIKINELMIWIDKQLRLF